MNSFLSAILEKAALGIVSKKYPGIAHGFEDYEQYVRPCIRAKRFYEHNKADGMPRWPAALKAAQDAQLPIDMFQKFLADKGEVLPAPDVLAGTAEDPSRLAFTHEW